MYYWRGKGRGAGEGRGVQRVENSNFYQTLQFEQYYCFKLEFSQFLIDSYLLSDLAR